LRCGNVHCATGEIFEEAWLCRVTKKILSTV
jgi:hypothetical protein